jgi:hypothetical protein
MVGDLEAKSGILEDGRGPWRMVGDLEAKSGILEDGRGF